MATRIPKDIKEALAMANASQTIRSVTMAKPVEILPGVWSDNRYSNFLVELFEELCRIDPEAQVGQSHILSLAGHPMDPTGIPHLSPEHFVSNRLSTAILAFIEQGAYVTFSGRDVRPLAIPKKSTFGFPYFIAGDEALIIKTAYIESYIKNKNFISDSIAEENFSTLCYAFKDFLPMYFIMHISRRLQTDGGVAELSKSGKLISFKPKPRIVFDWMDDETLANKTIIGANPFVASMRSRSISAMSASSNILLQLNSDPHRNYLYSNYLVFHPRVMQEHLDQFKANHHAEGGVVRSLDFTQFDSHMTSAFHDSMVEGVIRAGKSEAFVNLVRAVHYAPYLAKNDHLGGKGVRLVGEIGGKINKSLDLGNRSGEAIIDIENKIEGYGIIAAVAYCAGLLPATNLDEAKRLAWSRWAKLLPIAGEQCAPIVNAGDDCLIWFKNGAAEAAFQDQLKLIEDMLKIEFESIELTQVLGSMISQDLKAIPSITKSVANHVAPERGIDSKWRKDTWPLGTIARDAHYAEHPLWFEYRQAMDRTTMTFFKTTFMDEALAHPVRMPALNVRNAADVTFISDPDSIYYKILPSDVSEGLMEESGLFLSVQEEKVAASEI